MKNYLKLLRIVILFPVFLLLACSGSGGSGGGSNGGSGTLSISELVVTPKDLTAHAGTKISYSLTAVYNNGSSRVITESANWSSSDKSKVTINESSGLATLIESGQAIITASYQNQVATTKLTVVNSELESIVVTPANASLYPNTSNQFSAIGIYSDGSQDITLSANWTSANTGVVTIGNLPANKGVASAVAAGNAIIAASFGGKSANASVSVSSSTLKSIEVSPNQYTLPVGFVANFVAIGHYTDGTSKNITDNASWSASSGDIQVQSAGVVQALTPGDAQLIASTGTVESSAVVKSNPSVLVAITLSPITETIIAGSTKQYRATGVFNDGAMLDITDSVSWSSTQPTVAYVGDTPGIKGLVTSVTAGSSLIQATYAGITGNASLNVNATPQAELVSVILAPENPSVSIGLRTCLELNC